MRIKAAVYFLFSLGLFCSCDNYFKNDYRDNSPTSGQLKVYYDEGLRLHVRNQTLTFEANYPNARVELVETTESDAVQALLHDSCQAIVIARNLTEPERKMFAAQHYTPSFSKVAYTGVALIVNQSIPLRFIPASELISFLKNNRSLKDSLGNEFKPTVLFDKNNSGLLHYMIDSVLKQSRLPENCSVLGSSIESINYVASHSNAVAFVDFAWLSDVDDSITKANSGKIRFLAISREGSNIFEYPSQSSFKLGTYPFTRVVHVIRKTGEFSLAKGFESFVMGPKGQMIFLKQGLMPARQSERSIHINLEKNEDEKPEQ